MPCYTFRDHFYLTGPKESTTGIADGDDIKKTFSKLYNSAEAGNARFLSRFDKSATNIKDSELWINIGQVGLLDSNTRRNVQLTQLRYPGP